MKSNFLDEYDEYWALEDYEDDMKTCHCTLPDSVRGACDSCSLKYKTNTMLLPVDLDRYDVIIDDGRYTIVEKDNA